MPRWLVILTGERYVRYQWGNGHYQSSFTCQSSGVNSDISILKLSKTSGHNNFSAIFTYSICVKVPQIQMLIYDLTLDIDFRIKIQSNKYTPPLFVIACNIADKQLVYCHLIFLSPLFTFFSLPYMVSLAMPLCGLIIDKTGRNLIWLFVGVILSLSAHALLAFTFINPYVPVVSMFLVTIVLQIDSLLIRFCQQIWLKKKNNNTLLP